MLSSLVLVSSALAQPTAQPSPSSQAVDVEAGARMGPIRIGMSLPELRALGLPEADQGSAGRRFGPYLVQLDERGVRRIEARLGELGRVRMGGRVFDAAADIHAIRDHLGDCEWQEGGGEIYACAGGRLFVQTTHSLSPARYALVVTRGRE